MRSKENEKAIKLYHGRKSTFGGCRHFRSPPHLSHIHCFVTATEAVAKDIIHEEAEDGLNFQFENLHVHDSKVTRE